jgi:NADH-quinone oxidoreductase subunit G
MPLACGRRSRSARSRMAGTAFASCTRRRAGRRLDIGFVPGEGGKTAPQMASGGARCAVLARRRRDRYRSRTVRRLYRHAMAMRGAHRADVILPGAAYPEKSGTLRQHRRPGADGQPRRFPPGDAREDWAILRALSDVSAPAAFDSLPQLRQALCAAHPHLPHRRDRRRRWRRSPAGRTRRRTRKAPFVSP